MNILLKWIYLKTTRLFDDTRIHYFQKDWGTPLLYVNLKSKDCRKIGFFKSGICQNYFTIARKNTIDWKSYQLCYLWVSNKHEAIVLAGASPEPHLQQHTIST